MNMGPEGRLSKELLLGVTRIEKMEPYIRTYQRVGVTPGDSGGPVAVLDDEEKDPELKAGYFNIIGINSVYDGPHSLFSGITPLSDENIDFLSESLKTIQGKEGMDGTKICGVNHFPPDRKADEAAKPVPELEPQPKPQPEGHWTLHEVKGKSYKVIVAGQEHPGPLQKGEIYFITTGPNANSRGHLWKWTGEGWKSLEE